MRFAALIIAGETELGDISPLLFRIAGKTLLEIQISRLKAVGVSHIVLFSATVPAEFVAITDKLGRDGCSVELARSALDAADRLHPDETILVLDGPLLLDRSALEMLRDASKAAIMIVPAGTETAAFERINAQFNWLGAARIEGQQLRTLVAKLGDWSLGPTLLRFLVQNNAEDLPYAHVEGDFAALKPVSALHHSAAVRAAISAAKIPSSGWFSALLARWLVRPILPIIARNNISEAVFEIIHIILFLNIIYLSFSGSPFSAAVVFAVSLLPIQLGQGLASMTSTEARPRLVQSWMMRVSAASVIIAVLSLLAVHSPNWTGAVLGAWLGVQSALLWRAKASASLNAPFVNDHWGTAFVVGLGGLAGFASASVALAIALVSAELALRLHSSAP